MAWVKKVTAIGCSVIIAAASITGCTGGKSSGSIQLRKADTSSDDSGWQQTDSGMLTLENERFRFSLDAATTHFTVTDKQTGQSFASAADAESSSVSDETAAEMVSEIKLTYYTEQSEAFYMCSATDSVGSGQFKVISDNNAIRVYYSFGNTDEVVPSVFDEDTFNGILEDFGNEALVRRFSRYYIRYSSDEKPDDYKKMLERYPALKKQALYIIDPDVTDIDKGDISSYLSQVGFTSSDYKKMLEKLDITDDEENGSAGFVIPLEYSLNSDGFAVRLLTDRIEESGSKYKLQSVNILPYFYSSAGDNGSFFVPDGSGALVDYSNQLEALTVPCYGTDYSVRTESLDAIRKNAMFPVFGASTDSGGYFAIISSAAEVGDIHISPKSESSPLNHAYASFALRSIDVTDYGANMNIPTYNLFSKDLASAAPEIRYCILAEGKDDYSDMAALYREYLLEKGDISEASENKTPVYLDYICMITRSASMMGVPYTKKIVLSTVDEITASVKKMQQAGVGPIVVRLIGYTSSGYEHKPYNRFEIDKRVGTVNQLKELQKLLEENGGKLYLDADMQFAFKDGNGYSDSDTFARYLNRLKVSRGVYDIVTRDYSTSEIRQFLISPVYYEEICGDMITSIKKKWDSDRLPGLSYGSTGLELGGDYAKTRDIDRTESLAAVVKALDETKKNNISMLFDNGNAYVLPYASGILNTPLTSSLNDAEAKTVPFVQMVLHGCVSYAGTPQNVAAEQKTAKLSAALYAASPYAAFITRSDSLITNTEYQSLWYSLSIEERLDDFINDAKEICTAADKVAGKRITGYRRDGDISCTEYENGIRIYANFGSADAVADGINIPANGFAVGGN